MWMETDSTERADGEHPHLHIASQEAEERLHEKMREIELKQKEQETQVHAEQLGLGYINLRGFPIEADTLLLIGPEDAKRLGTVCFFWSGKEMRIGTRKPDDPRVQRLVEQLATDHHANVLLYLLSEYSLQWALKLYENVVVRTVPARGVEISPETLEKFRAELTTLHDLHERIKHVSVTDVLAIILAGAIQLNASDIHLEAEERDVKLRYRIDGVLQTISVLSKESWRKIVSRIKLVAGLKINIENQPQDGRVTIFTRENTIDVRVSTLPSAYGESVVMRLLMSATSGLTFEQLGLRGNPYRVLEREVLKPNGMIITTGPTSSGKTTTLYAILTKLNTPERKIITLEDPVEYHLEGINQSQIDASRGYTFAKGLRAVLRQNPDVVMVGEIRDAETADIGIHAALTGHLVLSTLHTNNAAGAVPRFLAMGIKPFLVAPALNAVIAQRLVRRICEQCKEEARLDEAAMAQVRDVLGAISPAANEKVDLEHLQFYRGKGCNACHGIGLRGRTGLYEIFTMNPEIEQIILSGKVSEREMQEIAIKHGMVLMVQDGLLKALDGMTTVEEVFRVARWSEEETETGNGTTA